MFVQLSSCTESGLNVDLNHTQHLIKIGIWFHHVRKCLSTCSTYMRNCARTVNSRKGTLPYLGHDVYTVYVNWNKYFVMTSCYKLTDKTEYFMDTVNRPNKSYCIFFILPTFRFLLTGH